MAKKKNEPNESRGVIPDLIARAETAYSDSMTLDTVLARQCAYARFKAYQDCLDSLNIPWAYSKNTI